MNRRLLVAHPSTKWQPNKKWLLDKDCGKELQEPRTSAQGGCTCTLVLFRVLSNQLQQLRILTSINEAAQHGIQARNYT